MIWVSYQIGCQIGEPCGFSGDHWQMQQCFNVVTDIYTVFFLALFNCCILLKIKLIIITITCEFNWLWWWLSNGISHTNGGGGSACDMNGNVKLMFDDRVAWHEFCREAGGGQGTTTTETARFIFDIIKSSQVNMIQYFDELNQKRVACRQNLVAYVSSVSRAQLRS